MPRGPGRRPSRRAPGRRRPAPTLTGASQRSDEGGADDHTVVEAEHGGAHLVGDLFLEHARRRGLDTHRGRSRDRERDECPGDRGGGYDEQDAQRDHEQPAPHRHDRGGAQPAEQGCSESGETEHPGGQPVSAASEDQVSNASGRRASATSEMPRFTAAITAIACQAEGARRRAANTEGRWSPPGRRRGAGMETGRIITSPRRSWRRGPRGARPGSPGGASSRPPRRRRRTRRPRP